METGADRELVCELFLSSYFAFICFSAHVVVVVVGFCIGHIQEVTLVQCIRVKIRTTRIINQTEYELWFQSDER
jgi:hypothetical protein